MTTERAGPGLRRGGPAEPVKPVCGSAWGPDADRRGSILKRLRSMGSRFGGCSHGDRVVPFDAAAARVWGLPSAEIGHDGADLRIAATALVAGFTIATRNTRCYAPTGVALVDPFESQARKITYSKSIA